jgi:peptide-methionine (S)-S-oxide reductase
MNKAMIAAGCFWGVEEIFRTTNGVINTKVGYSGGNISNPTYEQVCNNDTGHAEVVLIEFDDSISYESILNIFFESHNPTQLNRQGPDYGTQYRSSIFYFDETQKLTAENILNTLQPKFKNKIVTEITKAYEFFIAEDYHQEYVAKGGVCHF